MSAKNSKRIVHRQSDFSGGLGFARYGNHNGYKAGEGLGVDEAGLLILNGKVYTTTDIWTDEARYGVLGGRAYTVHNNELWMSEEDKVAKYTQSTRTWTSKLTLSAEPIGNVSHGDQYIQAQESTNNMQRTTDGTSWTDMGVPGSFLMSKWGILFRCRQSDDTLWYTTDLTSWTQITIPNLGEAHYMIDSVLDDVIIIAGYTGGAGAAWFALDKNLVVAPFTFGRKIGEIDPNIFISTPIGLICLNDYTTTGTQTVPVKFYVWRDGVLKNASRRLSEHFSQVTCLNTGLRDTILIGGQRLSDGADVLSQWDYTRDEILDLYSQTSGGEIFQCCAFDNEIHFNYSDAGSTLVEKVIEFDTYRTDGFIELAEYDAERPELLKKLKQIIIMTEPLETNVSLKLYHEIDDTGSYTLLETFDTDDDYKHVVDVDLDYYKIKLKLELLTTDSSKTAKVKDIVWISEVGDPYAT